MFIQTTSNQGSTRQSEISLVMHSDSPDGAYLVSSYRAKAACRPMPRGSGIWYIGIAWVRSSFGFKKRKLQIIQKNHHGAALAIIRSNHGWVVVVHPIQKIIEISDFFIKTSRWCIRKPNFLFKYQNPRNEKLLRSTII